MSNRRRVRGVMPWPTAGQPDEGRDDLAPRQLVPYTCVRGHQFTVPFAAEATAPSAWDCRCGAAAGLVQPCAVQSEHERHMGQLLGRRSPADLETLLAARLAEIRGRAG